MRWALLLVLCSLVFPAHGQQDGLTATIIDLERQLGARIGVAIHDLAAGQRFAYRGDERFPLSSTFKVLACGALLVRVDAGLERLDRVVSFAVEDLVDYSPVTEGRVGPPGMTLEELCAATLATSDNTAGNLVLAAIGGPDAVTRLSRSIGDDMTRLDRWETALNEGTPGDPRDTTTPAAMATALEKLVLGDVLTTRSRDTLQQWLQANQVGDPLLRAGIPADWRIADKTGAGGHGSRSIAAVLWPPMGGPVIATVYITETDASMEARNAAIAHIGRVIADQQQDD
ncbi:MAG: beta-lactamase class [Pseudomonadota bacterium]